MSTGLADRVAPDATRPVPGRSRRLTWWLRITALGMGAAGALHVAAAVDHLGAGDLAVGFFLLTALAQVGLAGWLLMTSFTSSAPDRRLVALALLGTVGLLGLYLVAHATTLLDAFAIHETGATGHAHENTERMLQFDPVTGVDFFEGMPIATDGPVAMDGAPVAAQPHGPQALGTVTVAVEMLAVLGLSALLPASWRRVAVNGLFGLGALAWALWFAGVLG